MGSPANGPRRNGIGGVQKHEFRRQNETHPVARIPAHRRLFARRVRNGSAMPARSAMPVGGMTGRAGPNTGRRAPKPLLVYVSVRPDV